MLVNSKYNYVHQMTGKRIVYNALSQCILVLDEDQNIEDFRDESSISTIQQFLVQNHFLVHSETDEEKLMNLYRMESVMQNDLQLMILPTSACNFKCIYCYENLKPLNMNADTKQNIELFIKRELRKYQRLYVDWFGGEPLLQKECIYELSRRILDVCHLYNKQYVSSITTNGSLLDVETFQRLIDCHVYTYTITLDGPAHIHDKLKPYANGDGSFEDIINNLINIKRNVSTKRFTVMIRVNVTKQLLDVFDEFLEFLFRIFGDDSRFTFMFRVVKDCTNERISDIKEQIIDNVDEIYEYLLRSETTLDCRGHYELLKNRICFGAKRNSYAIYVDGKIYKCPSLIGDDKSKIGHLGEHGVLLVDKELLSKWFNADSINKMGKCENCSFAPSCVSCPAKVHVLDNKTPCIIMNERLDKVLELLNKSTQKHTYGFVYKISGKEIVQC